MKVAFILFKYSVSIHDPCCYPLGFMYACAKYKDNGHTVDVFNENLGQALPDFSQYDLIAMTGFEEFLPRIKEVSAECRKQKVATILGGALATFRPKEMADIVDYVVEGEMDTGRLWPDYEAFGIEEYHRRHNLRYMGVLTSRGCPFNCSFCAHTCDYSIRDLDDVFAEIEHYKRTYEITRLVFYDNTFNVSKTRFLDICEFLKGKDLKWSAALRADKFDSEMAKAMKESGGDYCIVGVESFKQEKLDAMGKRLSVAQIKRTLDLLHEYDIKYHGNIILGLHGDTIPDIIEELETLPKGYNVFPVLAQPFIGTQVQSDLTCAERDMLNRIFKDYAELKGMTVFGGIT